MSTRYYADIICALPFQVQLKPPLQALVASPSASSGSRSFHFAESRRKNLMGKGNRHRERVGSSLGIPAPIQALLNPLF
jgi:hypothetical protein